MKSAVAKSPSATMRSRPVGRAVSLGSSAYSEILSLITQRECLLMESPSRPISDDVAVHIRYDLASQEILEKVGQVMMTLENQGVQLSTLLAAQQHSFSAPLSKYQTGENYGVPISAASKAPLLPGDVHNLQGPDGEAALLSESLEFAGTNTGKCEDLLEWPVFGGMYHRSETETLIFNPDLAGDHNQQGLGCPVVEPNADRRSASRGGVREDDVLRHVQKFLENVHIKNPILNIDDVIRMAKDIMEYGFKWDAPSCLVVRTLLSLLGLSH